MASRRASQTGDDARCGIVPTYGCDYCMARVQRGGDACGVAGFVAPAGTGVPAGVTGFAVATEVTTTEGAGADAGIVGAGAGIVIAVGTVIAAAVAAMVGGGVMPAIVVPVVSVAATEVVTAILVAVALITPVVARAVAAVVAVVIAVGAVVGTACVGIGVTRGD